MTARRTILHVDLDAFFAAVEQRDDPRLRGKPVLVGGSRERGVVAAASYEARIFGVHSAMPMAEALRRCPQAIVVSHSFGRYGEASQAFFRILDDFSPLVEPLSLDEGFLDLTGTERLLGAPRELAVRLKQRVATELALVASVGIAPSKFVAKIASDIDKPDGLVVIEDGQVEAFLHPLPLSRLWGVGKVTEDKLLRLGLKTIGEVARYPREVLRARLTPAMGDHLADLARGIDPREVHHRGGAVSIGHEQTFDVDIAESGALRPILLGQADRVAARLRRSSQCGRVVTLKLKYADFRTVTRQRSLADATCDADEIARIAVELLRELPVDALTGKTHAVRLCGISVGKLEERLAGRQLVLDEASRQKKERLGDTLDLIHERFGDAAIGRAINQPKERLDKDEGRKPGDTPRRRED